MDIKKLESIGIDYSDGLNRMGGSQDFYNKMFAYFIEDDTFSKLQENLKKQDYDNAFIEAHTLKGVVANLSMNELYERVSALTEALRHHEFEKVSDLNSFVQKEYNLVVNTLKKEFNIK